MTFRSFFFLCSLPAATLVAEDTLESVTLDPVDVTARRPAPLTVPSAEAAAADLRLTPGGVETVVAERWLRGRASTVDDTFALSPGVVALSRF
ncbi:MAG: TonB-dependent receptor, partial [Cephaloticoccus sp.]